MAVAAVSPSAGAHPRLTTHPSRLAIGVNTRNAPDADEIAAYTRLSGAAPAVVMWYQEFDTPLFTHTQMRDIRSLDATPMISWRPVLDGHTAIQFDDIATGKYDDYLTRQAMRARNLNRPIFVRFAYEMNLAGQDYGGHVPGETPTAFVAAWRHIVTVFRNEGASNARFVWSPNTDCAGHCPFTQYWPGNAYVDWLALDGYNFAAAHNASWVSLHYIFATSYATITKLSSRPLMIAETGCAPAPGDKARWIRRGFRHAIPEDFPRVRAVIWFNQDKETDWRVNSSPDALTAWRSVVATKRYSGRIG